MKRPSEDAFLLAAAWLDEYNGEDMADCLAVSEWLREKVAKRRESETIRAASKKYGVPAGKIREALAKKHSGT